VGVERRQKLGGRKVSFGDDETVLELDMLIVVQHCECTKPTEVLYFKTVNMVNFISIRKD
jgi:hypothetical protein